MLNKKNKKVEFESTIINKGLKIRIQNIKQFGFMYQ